MCSSSVEGDTRKDRFLMSMANSISANLSIAFFDFFSSVFSTLTLYPKSKTWKKKTQKKNSGLFELNKVSEFLFCHFLEFLIKCPRFKFRFRQIEFFQVSRVLCFLFLLCLNLILQGIGFSLLNMVLGQTAEENCRPPTLKLTLPSP